MDLRFCLEFVSLRSSLCYRVLSQCLYLEQNTTKRNSISATLGCLQRLPGRISFCFVLFNANKCKSFPSCSRRHNLQIISLSLSKLVLHYGNFQNYQNQCINLHLFIIKINNYPIFGLPSLFALRFFSLLKSCEEDPRLRVISHP